MDKLEIIEGTDFFWEIIYKADKSRDDLKVILQNLSKEKLKDFQAEFYKIAIELQDEPFTNHMEESEDGIEDISYWIVSQGKKYYMEVWNKPEMVPYSVEEKSDEILFDIGLVVYLDRFNETLDIW